MGTLVLVPQMPHCSNSVYLMHLGHFLNDVRIF